MKKDDAILLLAIAVTLLGICGIGQKHLHDRLEDRVEALEQRQ